MKQNAVQSSLSVPAIAAVLSIFGLTVCTPAHAAVVEYTFTGTVANGYDTVDAFGTGPNLAGQSFKLVQTFDTEHGNYRSSDAQQSFQVGGFHINAPDSAAASLKIGTETKTIADYSDFIFASSSSGHIQEFIASGDGANHAWVGFNIYAPSIAPDYASLPSLSGHGATFIGSYQLYDAGGNLAVYADLRVDQLTVGNGLLASVPLPASLPSFAFGLLGLACFGARALRRV